MTKVHWGRLGSVGAFVGGLVLFVAGVAVGGEGEYLMEHEKMAKIEYHDRELEHTLADLTTKSAGGVEREHALMSEIITLSLRTGEGGASQERWSVHDRSHPFRINLVSRSPVRD